MTTVENNPVDPPVPPPATDFMSAYMELNKGTEIPPLFALWSGIGALSCVLKRQCWLDMGTYQIFPNMFIVLIASSGRCRKSTSISVMKRLVRQVVPSPNIISQKITPEALVQAIKVDGGLGDGVVNLDKQSNEGFVLADEFATFLNRRTYDSGIGDMLIQFFDCEDPFSYETKKDGKQVVDKSCLGLLAASTADWLRTAIPESAIGGGLTSRMIFVYVENPPPPIAWTEFSEAKGRLQDSLVEHLGKISEVKGPASLTPKAKDWFVGWYEGVWMSENGTLGSGDRFFNYPDLAGYASRRHVHMLKLAMLFAVTELNLTIGIKHLELADKLLEKTEQHLFKVMTLISSTEGNKTEVVKGIIFRTSVISLKELVRQTQHQMTYRELADAIQSLEAGGQIKKTSDGNGMIIRKLIVNV